MNREESTTRPSGLPARVWHRLSTPSARWSVLALVIVGLLVGAGGGPASQ